MSISLADTSALTLRYVASNSRATSMLHASCQCIELVSDAAWPARVLN
eukprot:CAMPEP_0198579970 /NCGR_PEP_ID=MMETSP1462-20131121/122260_1 /TAXON_ID=1333877 /ORGANISM="Brandtodinium nutriculum, Strain RCC3387" /LENGTH=47 /DNA_ID= /DNA_START= /DNA_END= /DNA_ORIENTATION=